jgi:hypothetical protein
MTPQLAVARAELFTNAAPQCVEPGRIKLSCQHRVPRAAAALRSGAAAHYPRASLREELQWTR